MEYQRITLRIPIELHKLLLELSEDNSKSMNAEIINRLQASTRGSQQHLSIENLREVIREELSKHKP